MIDVLGPEKRRRRTTQEKIAIVQQSFEPGMTVSLVARQHGVAASQLFLWRKQYQEGSLTAVAAGEQVVPASELAAAMKQIKELQRLLGKKTMENELLKEAVEYGRGKKVDSARALIARGWGVNLVSRCLRVSRAQLHVILRRTDDWMDGRRSRHTDDTDVLLRIHHVIGELPTYGYRRVWALLRRQAELDGMPAINAKRVYRIMRQNALLLERKPAVPPSKRAHTGRVAVKESNQRWCSDGFEFCCDNGERLRVTFALDCCDREALHWAVTTGGFNSETVQDVMLGAVERRFGNDLPSSPVEWLTDNGSCYRANETRQFARMLGLEPKNTAVRSPESNGIAESFVKTIKRDYISIMPKPDGLTAAKNLAEAFEHYNEWHPHSALGYRSPREYLRQRACNGLSDNRCLEI
ncbi:IS3-like element IS2 family transposase [Salmonella enterica subsp. enterica serovar Anatum]|uniref:IS3-like element IS2 family transposase n=1 Tax=Salmonella enterica TaxID=28901 RepID=UPI0018741BE5|nr:IS3-like element IS2 family transposase [Salmonella enterica]EID8802711.1 IS3-like element IS2 family transposase [Escherichia coli]EIO9456875.1 IS3-like element IS2 family transposase [Salmonella enterica subsp. enterica serovar Anatum]EIP3410058.1 IS3-like element IS2 family transposase [Salmonella enterica subsp. enterica serovar Anatum]EIP8053615.1 IS3-like element IS2 family transposase [Salmonella enterica subsp. enterica serovar Anatum]EIY8393881.1 IS3-like element IS2 family transpo